ncbi:hypothetical protein tinsulaeT_23790 [Thalassotalea insulae]|uniref:DUF4390 domain-containing protein n=1 Tax=Thalassotalea insulae TaxID=2056778 RepID=A0ABQ6GUL4_9GAMM|nr:hypothetical protein [Thalassotalea insulae]GLX79039.1 hypothetical protein tinsulaeT_23790 [Thalassotalea insulae]
MKKLLLILVVCGLFETATVTAHGLNMTTANITVRQKNHLSVRVATSLTALFRHMQWQGKPLSIAHMVSDEGKLEEFHQRLEQMFSEQLTILVEGKPLQSRQIRLMNLTQLRQYLRSEVAEAVLPQRDKHESYQDFVINIDGFMPSTGKGEKLKINFPVELGPIMTSYSEPKIQTLAKGEQVTRYQLQLP